MPEQQIRQVRAEVYNALKQTVSTNEAIKGANVVAKAETKRRQQSQG